jgi:hypothetical protein
MSREEFDKNQYIQHIKRLNILVSEGSYRWRGGNGLLLKGFTGRKTIISETPVEIIEKLGVNLGAGLRYSGGPRQGRVFFR